MFIYLFLFDGRGKGREILSVALLSQMATIAVARPGVCNPITFPTWVAGTQAPELSPLPPRHLKEAEPGGRERNPPQAWHPERVFMTSTKCSYSHSQFFPYHVVYTKELFAFLQHFSTLLLIYMRHKDADTHTYRHTHTTRDRQSAASLIFKGAGYGHILLKLICLFAYLLICLFEWQTAIKRTDFISPKVCNSWRWASRPQK